MVWRLNALLRNAERTSRPAQRKRCERRNHRLQNRRPRRRHSPPASRSPRPRRRPKLRPLQIRLGKTVRTFPRSRNGALHARRNSARRGIQDRSLLLHVRSKVLLHELLQQSGRIQQAGARAGEEGLLGTGGEDGYDQVSRVGTAALGCPGARSPPAPLCCSLKATGPPHFSRLFEKWTSPRPTAAGGSAWRIHSHGLEVFRAEVDLGDKTFLCSADDTIQEHRVFDEEE